MPRRAVDPSFGIRLRALLEQTGTSYRTLATRTFYGKSFLHDLASGRRAPSSEAAARLDAALNAGGTLAALVSPAPVDQLADDELDALELLRRVEASDVSAGTLARLEAAVDDLATGYATTPPEKLLPLVRQHLAYVGRLIEARATLDQRRRVLVAGGWLSLLGGTVHIDLQQTRAAGARLATADQMAVHAGHDEIRAWVLETNAWERVTAGQYPAAVQLAIAAQNTAPRGSSAHIQATAQEGRAHARMRQRPQTRAALDRVERLAAGLEVPERPEHHYRYDPDKALSYTATTLAWAGDPAAEEYARAVIEQLEVANGAARPRRIAAARLDLGLALLAAGKPDEAAGVAVLALTSGRVVPSNWWRASEVLAGVERARAPEAAELRAAYEDFRPQPATDEE